MAELLAALAYGERAGARRARDNVRFAPDARRRQEQEHVAAREEQNCRLVEARLAEVGSVDRAGRFRPYFDAFFERTEPADWVEAQTFHYVGDALVSDFADWLVRVLDPVTATVVRQTLGDREGQEAFALDELTRAMDEAPSARERIAVYARRIVGEGLTQTRRALAETGILRDLLGSEEVEKRVVLDLLERHRVRLDRLGIEPVEPASAD